MRQVPLLSMYSIPVYFTSITDGSNGRKVDPVLWICVDTRNAKFSAGRNPGLIESSQEVRFDSLWPQARRDTIWTFNISFWFMFKVNSIHCYKDYVLSPGYCGSVGWTLPCTVKGPGFDFWWGHVPRLQARSLVRVHVGRSRSMFLSLSPFSL